MHSKGAYRAPIYEDSSMVSAWDLEDTMYFWGLDYDSGSLPDNSKHKLIISLPSKVSVATGAVVTKEKKI